MSDAPAPKKFYGKYRGTVLLNVDPEFRGRLMCQVPDVLGVLPSNWCEACPPLAGPTGPPMGVYMVPPIGAGVWVEFEQGDPDYPIWVGCFWGSTAEVPALALAVPPLVPAITLQTPLQNVIQISDVPGIGGILLKTTTGAAIMINETGIIIQNGQGASIVLAGPSVTVNAGALVVT